MRGLRLALYSQLSTLNSRLSTIYGLSTLNTRLFMDSQLSTLDYQLSYGPRMGLSPPGASWFKEELLVASTRRG